MRGTGVLIRREIFALRQTRDIYTQRTDCVRIQQEEGHLQAEERALRYTNRDICPGTSYPTLRRCIGLRQVHLHMPTVSQCSV